MRKISTYDYERIHPKATGCRKPKTHTSRRKEAAAHHSFAYSFLSRSLSLSLSLALSLSLSLAFSLALRNGESNEKISVTFFFRGSTQTIGRAEECMFDRPRRVAILAAATTAPMPKTTKTLPTPRKGAAATKALCTGVEPG